MVSTEEFIARLRRFQLFSGQQLEQLIVAARTIPTEALLGRLVESRWLSSWQAKQLLHNQPMLRIGSYLLWNLEVSRNGREIYSARHVGDQSVSVLKTWAGGYFHSQEEVAAVEQIARQVQLVRHPHLVKVLDVGRYRSAPFFVMELVSGADLQQLIQEQGPLPATWACECVRQVATALHQAAQNGLTHGRLRPSKILVAESDFRKTPVAKLQGLAISQAAANDHHGSTVTTGSPLPQGSDYMAPEWAVDPAKFAHPSADIYSLGVLLFHLLAGRLPFPGDTPLAVWNSRFNNIPLLQLRMVRPDLPSSIDVLLSRMMAFHPDGRFRSHEELAQALRPFCGGPPGPTQVPPPRSDAAQPAHLPPASAPAQPAPVQPAPASVPSAVPPAPQAASVAASTTNLPPGLAALSGEMPLPEELRGKISRPPSGVAIAAGLPSPLPPPSGSGIHGAGPSSAGTSGRGAMGWCVRARESGLLSAAEAAQLEHEPSSRAAAAQALERGWVTSWQLEQSAAGRKDFRVGPYVVYGERRNVGNYFEYLAWDAERFAVLLKAVRGKHAADRELLRRLKREGRLAGALDHPNLLGGLEAGDDGDWSYLALESPVGPTLAEVIAAQQNIPPGWACEVVRQAALGLHVAAQKKILHRGLSPAAICVGSADTRERPRVKVFGWGHADTPDRNLRGSTATDIDSLVGDADYMAPEQADAPRQVDVRADIYALASILFHTLAGQPPVDGPSALDKLDLKRKDAPPRVKWRRAEITAELDHFLAQMMEVDPQLRPKSMAEVAERLLPFAVGGWSGTPGTPRADGPRTELGGKPAADLDELFRSLGKSRLLGADECARLRQSMPNLIAPRIAADKLVHAGKLTAWQAGRLLVGKTDFRLGEFVLRDQLGSGVHTITYLADPLDGTGPVALKTLRPEDASDEGCVTRFHRGGRLATELRHPNLMGVRESVELDGRHFQVLEHLRGIDLSRWLSEYQRLRVGWACEVVRQAALGLQYAHDREIIHRDLRPAKLMLVESVEPPELTVKILGLGLAYTRDWMRNGTVVTNPGDLVGSPDYISPEQYEDATRTDARSDVYALGCTLFHLLCGRPPFEGAASAMGRMSQRFDQPPPALRQILPSLPADLEALVAKLMARRPEDRPASAEEVAELLARFAQPLPASLAELRGQSAQDLSAVLAEKGGVFLAALETHQVLEGKALAEARRRFAAVPEGRRIAEALIDEGRISRWQAGQLLSGRPRLTIAGKYRLEDLQAAGLRESTFRGRDRLRRPIRVSLLDTPESDLAVGRITQAQAQTPVERLLAEGRFAAVLDHPGIAGIIDTGRDADQWFVVEDAQAVRTLAQVLDEGRPQPLDWSCEVIRRVALALEHARKYGVLHLSLTPADIDVGVPTNDVPPRIKVGRLGIMNIGKLLESSVSGSRRNLPEPIDFVAPEQIDRASQADGRADVFSLGALLFALLCGRVPFPANTPLERLLARYAPQPPLAGAVVPEVPTELDMLLARMLAGEAKDRPATAGDVALALEPFCGQYTEEAIIPDVPPAPVPAAPAAVAGAVQSQRDQWSTLLRKSGLLEGARLEAAERQLAGGASASDLGVWLIQQGWVTVWQWEQLLQGAVDFRIGKFLLLGCLGRGAAGAVYKAQNPEGETIALKVLNEDKVDDRVGMERFLREGRVSLQLSHPNVAGVYAVMEEGRRHFMVMEYVDGLDLKAWMQRGPLAVDWACECIRQAALGLQHALEQGVVHRDIKPSNLVVRQGEDGLPHLKILDMGVALIAHREVQGPSLTRMGDVLGTPDYMAPEQAKDASQVDIRADIYSLGCTLFHLLTGYLPFDGDTAMAKLMARLRTDAPPIRRYRADLPPELEAVLARMLARNPAQRYQTPQQVADALQPFSLTAERPGDDSESRHLAFGSPEVEEFFAHLQRSTLLPDPALRDFRRVAVTMRTPQEAALYCIEQGWITRWQSKQLLDGRNNFQFGNYLLMDLVGRGATGFVYKALDPHQNLVALKVLSAELIKRPEAVARFRREMRVVAALHHPNIVRSYDAGQLDEQTLYIAMEFVTGRDLKSWLNQVGALPIAWSVECLRQAALGMQHAHEKGIVHRDIKPGNLLVIAESLDEIPTIKLLDLGFANATGNKELSSSQLTKHDQLLGTPDYMSPEQANDPTSVDIRSDIYSLGCTLFRLLTNRAPFLGSTPIEKLNARFREDAPPIRSLRPDVPPELEAIAAKMMARLPEHRYQLPVDVAEALAPFSLSRLREQEQKARRKHAPRSEPAGAPRSAGAHAAGQQAPRVEQPAYGAAPVAVAVRPEPAGLPPAPPPGGRLPPGPGMTVGGPARMEADEEPIVLETAMIDVREPSANGSAGGGGLFSRLWRWLRGLFGGATEEEAEAPLGIPDGWLASNLLAAIDPNRHACEGKWIWTERGLRSPDVAYARVMIPGRVPPRYRLMVLVERFQGEAAFVVGLIVGGRQCFVTLDGWGGDCTGLGVLDGKPYNENPTTWHGQLLPEGRFVRLVFDVAPDAVRLTADRTTVFAWTGESARLGMSPNWNVIDSGCLFVGSHSAMFNVRELLLLQPGDARNG